MSMRVMQSLDSLEPGERPRVICVGAFDGFHLGHQYLLNRVCALAEERDFESGLVTFEPPPAAFFAPADLPPRRLMTLQERIALAAALCCEVMAVLEFNAELAAQPAEWFVREVLAQRLGVRLLVASSTHTMGHDRADIRQITEICHRHGLEVAQLPIMQLEALRISSSEIRQRLWEGDVEQANTMLGRHYSLAGKVKPGRAVGRGMGFPTANIEPPAEKLVPMQGVYAGIATDVTPEQEAQAWPAAISIGTAPTFGVDRLIVEAHLLEERVPDLTGHILRLEFVHYLRPQKKFDSPQELAAQIAQDVAQTREFCHTLTPRSGFAQALPFCPRE